MGLAIRRRSLSEMNVLIVYGTTEGHTRDVCQYIQHVLDERPVESAIADAGREPPDPSAFDVCFIAASLHVGNYQAFVIDYVCLYHEILSQKPSAFLSVSLSAAGENPDDWEGVTQCVQRFTHKLLGHRLSSTTLPARSVTANMISSNDLH